MKPKIFKMNECDYWIDFSFEEAKYNYTKFTSTTPEGNEWDQFPPEELTEEQLNSYNYYDAESNKVTSFKKELENRLKENKIPGFFATTED